MTENLSTALGITTIGMGLVFGGILVLWGLISLLVRFTGENSLVEEAASSDDEHERRRKAAGIAASVALVMQEQTDEPQAFPLPPTALVSAWQAVRRANQLRQRGPR